MSDYKGFQSVKLTRPKKSTFDLSHDKRLTTRMGRLTPCMCIECVPSDSFSGSSEMLVRLAPLLAPIYDRIEVFVHYFFVPSRLLWDEWEEFITGGRLGAEITTPPIVPNILIGPTLTEDPLWFAPSSLADYLGVPVLPTPGSIAANYNTIGIDLMPFAAYQLIWFEYYRDRNFVGDDYFQDNMPMVSGEFDETFAPIMLTLKTRSYKHDYFTSALPFTQRGAEVLIPVDAAVTYLDQAIYVNNSTSADPTTVEVDPVGAADGRSNFNSAGVAGPHGIENIESISNTTTTINDFRSAYALQVWMERNAIAGSRYTESTQAHFDVKPQDERLQRPEYIGGGRIAVKISEVLSTAWANDGTDEIPQANMAGHGVTYGNTNNFRYFCMEHGFILGIMSIMNPPSYHQGMPKMFRRRSFLDYPWPTFAKLGEQQVDKAELFASHTNLTENGDGELPLFGYQSRYADWKYIPNWNHGLFHDDLLFWTLTRQFATSPTLSAEFNEFDDATQDRIFAVNGGEDNFWIYCHNRVTVKRPLPYFGTPNTLGFV